jgi:WD40 repeat protein
VPPPGDGDIGPGEEPDRIEGASFSTGDAAAPPAAAPAQSQNVVWQTAGAGAALTFAPDGQTLLEGNRLHRASDGELIRTLDARTRGGQMDAVAFSPDGQYAAIGLHGFNLNLSLTRVSDGARLAVLTGSGNGVTTLKFSPDGQYLACGGRGGAVNLYHVPDMTVVKTFFGGPGYNAVVFALLFSNDGQYLAVGGQGGAQIVRVSDGAVTHTLVGGGQTITSLALSPDGQTLATGFFTADEHNLYPVKFWRFSDGALLKTIEASDQGILALAFSPDGEVVAAAGGDDTYSGVVRFYRLSDSVQLGYFPQDPNNAYTYVTSVVYSPDGQLVAYARHDDFIVVARNPFPVRQPPAPPPAPPPSATKGDNDPIPPPGDGSVGEEPPGTR